MTENDTIKALNDQWYLGYQQGYEAAANKFILSLRQHLEGMIEDTEWKLRQLDRHILKDEVEE